MMSASQMGAIGEGSAGLFALHVGLRNARLAKQEAARLNQTRPKYSISPYATDELALAESEAANPMSAQAQAAYNQQTDRDLSTSLDAILKGGGSPNNVGDIFDRSQQGRQRLAMFTDQMRLNKINNLVNSYRNMQEQEDRKFQFNDWAPWADAAQANANARAAAAALQFEGFKTFAHSNQTFAGSGGGDSGGSYSGYNFGSGGGSSPSSGNFSFNQSSNMFSQPNDITGQTQNSPYMNSIGGGSQGWYGG